MLQIYNSNTKPMYKNWVLVHVENATNRGLRDYWGTTRDQPQNLIQTRLHLRCHLAMAQEYPQ